MPEVITVQFGDNNFADFVEQKSPKLNREKQWVTPICLKPERRLIREADIPKDELEKEEGKPKGTVWREYPTHWVMWIYTNWLFIWCDFNGKDTLFTQKMQGLGDYIDLKTAENESLKDGLAEAKETIWNLMAQRVEDEKKRKELEDVRKSKEGEEGEEEKKEGEESGD